MDMLTYVSFTIPEEDALLSFVSLLDFDTPPGNRRSRHRHRPRRLAHKN